MLDPGSRMHLEGWRLLAGVMLAALVLAGCGGSTSTTTVVRTQTATVTVPGTTTTVDPASNTIATSTSQTTTVAPATTAITPALNGSYAIDQTSHEDSLDVLYRENPHDGIYNADLRWTVLGGGCTPHGCRITLRRILSDDTLEGLVLFARSPTGVYTGKAPGTLGNAQCGVPIKERMIIRVGGVRQINGQQVATRLAGHIFADFQCPGSVVTQVVATYTGARS